MDKGFLGRNNTYLVTWMVRSFLGALIWHRDWSASSDKYLVHQRWEKFELIWCFISGHWTHFIVSLRSKYLHSLRFNHFYVHSWKKRKQYYLFTPSLSFRINCFYETSNSHGTISVYLTLYYIFSDHLLRSLFLV